MSMNRTYIGVNVPESEIKEIPVNSVDYKFNYLCEIPTCNFHHSNV